MSRFAGLGRDTNAGGARGCVSVRRQDTAWGSLLISRFA
jgi:hypothetical protein